MNSINVENMINDHNNFKSLLKVPYQYCYFYMFNPGNKTREKEGERKGRLKKTCESESDSNIGKYVGLHCTAIRSIFFVNKMFTSSSKLYGTARSIQNAKVQRMHVEALCTPVRIALSILLIF
jgi:hypothetical protein